MKKEEISKREMFTHSLEIALIVPACIVGAGMLIVGLDPRAAFIGASGSMFFHFIGYLVMAPLIFLMLGPNSDLWMYHWGVLAGGFLGAAILGVMATLFGGPLHEMGIYVLIGAGYGYVTAFAIVRAREKMLEQ